ncbi:hypothetical protein CMI41_04565 [Candidatus Pacearchaeota archaeon]|nr:hypothetical protein [Candidatus Pacearchaeota archaeon]|tara:strand:+ start:13265 stop:13570 length:306 start_codon:yes stop_codon:yes gene_type:complete
MKSAIANVIRALGCEVDNRSVSYEGSPVANIYEQEPRSAIVHHNFNFPDDNRVSFQVRDVLVGDGYEITDRPSLMVVRSQCEEAREASEDIVKVIDGILDP